MAFYIFLYIFIWVMLAFYIILHICIQFYISLNSILYHFTYFNTILSRSAGPMLVATFLDLSRGGSWGSMLAHVEIILAQGGTKLAPRWLKIALCWLKLAPRRPKWLPKASQVSQDAFKKASRWLPNPYVVASCLFFYDFQDCWQNNAFSNERWSSGTSKVFSCLDF